MAKQIINNLDSLDSVVDSLNNNYSDIEGGLGKGLTVYKDNTTLFGYYPKLEGTSTVDSMGDFDCDPVYLEGGSALTALQFSDCAYDGVFTLSDTSGLTSLTSLHFDYCGNEGDFFTLSDTSGLTSLTSLNFSDCAYHNDGVFTLSDTSGLTSLVTLYISECGYAGIFLPTTVDAVGTLTALTSFIINRYCGTTSATELKLIADACLANPVIGGVFKLENIITGDKTALNLVLTQLRAAPKLWEAPAV